MNSKQRTPYGTHLKLLVSSYVGIPESRLEQEAKMEEGDDYAYLLEMLDVDGYASQHGNYSLEDFLSVSMDYEQEEHWFQPTEEMCFILLFVFLIFLGLVGNGLVCFIVIRKGRRQSTRNWYILNLAVSDILTCILCTPPTLVRLVLKNWPLGHALCKLVPSLQTVYVFVSTFTLVALAVDRYRAVMCPGQYGRVHVSPMYCLLLIWLLSLAMAVPIFVVHRLEEVKGFRGYVLYTVCLEQWDSQSSLTVYTIFVLLLQYCSPLAAIVVLHLLIGNFLRLRNVAEGTARLPECQWQRKRRRHRKNMCLLTSMAASFAVSWLPLHVINALAFIDYMIFKDSHFPLIHAVCMVLAFSSVCLNPVIYGLLNSNFRRDLQRIFRCDRTSARPCRHSCGSLYQRKGSRHTEQCGLISASPLEMSQSCGAAVRKGEVISAV